MSDANFPGGAGIVTENTAGLEVNDFNFIGNRPSDSNPAQTLYSELKNAILGGVSLSIDTAIFWDEKPSGTRGGTFTSGAWRIRDINNLDCPSGFCSLSSNQLTLDAGNYLFFAACPAFAVKQHQSGLYNVSLGSFHSLGMLCFAIATNLVQNSSFILTNVNIGSQQIFEIRHQCDTTRSDDGFGNLAVFSDNGVYTIGSIVKI